MNKFLKKHGLSAVMSSTHCGGVTIYLRKSWWLRAYHALLLADTSPFLLDSFNNPVCFNKLPDDVEQTTYRCCAIIENADLDKRMIFKVNTSISDLVWKPYKNRLSGRVVDLVTTGYGGKGLCKRTCLPLYEAMHYIND